MVDIYAMGREVYNMRRLSKTILRSILDLEKPIAV